MKDNYYTHALWQVHEGKEAEFIAAWKEFATAIGGIPGAPPASGVLIQNLTDSSEFYSFGPWESLEAIRGMRNNVHVKEAMQKLLTLCIKATPASYKTVAKLSFPGHALQNTDQ